MSVPSKYEQWIRLLDWHGVEELWTSLRAGRVPGWDPGKAFEYLILRAFELDGAEVRWPYTVSAQGQVVEQIDGAVHAGNLRCLIEAKDSARAVSFDAVAKLREHLSRRPPGVIGLLFSRSSFSEPAIALARFQAPQNILLWSGNDLTIALGKRTMVRALEAKYRYAVEEGTPKYELDTNGVPWV